LLEIESRAKLKGFVIEIVVNQTRLISTVRACLVLSGTFLA